VGDTFENIVPGLDDTPFVRAGEENLIQFEWSFTAGGAGFKTAIDK
jgi:hypothetical protein